MFKKIKKLSLVALINVVLFVTIFGNFAFPAPAQAIPTVSLSDVTAITFKALDGVYAVVKSALISAGVMAATYALRKVAYDSAVWVASGGKGQNPLAHSKGFAGYLGDVVNESAGTFIESMSNSAGVNLCKVPDIKIDLAIKVGLRTRFNPTQSKPNCTLTQFTKNWTSGDAWSKYTSKDSLMKNFSASISANDSDLGVYLTATEKIDRLILQQKEAAVYNRVEGGGFKPMTTLISDQIKTPAENIKNIAQTLNPQTNFEQAERKLEAAVASGDAKVFPAVLSIFLSTLGGTIINNFQNKGILPLVGCVTGACKQGGSSGSAGGTVGNPLFEEFGAGMTTLGKAAAQSFFSYFATVKIRETTKYNLVSQLNSCPDSPGVYNCRAGDDLVSAIGQGLTIGEAIKLGILDGNKKLISPSSGKFKRLSNSIDCYQSAYCYNNAKILRQVRILPLGFEIAIQNADVNDAPTLKNVVDGFNDCPDTPAAFNPIAHRYCHLIDPNWVLKAPEAKCNALVNTATLLSQDVPTRLQDCVDLQTCVKYTPDGNCADFQYCTREKNTWKFSAESCLAQYASCITFQNPKGAAVSYLERTLDDAFCTADNVGCSAYSLTRDATGQWLDPSFDEPSRTNRGIFLNALADKNTCSSDSAGCSAFEVASGGETLYLKKAPTYLGCYDSNPTTPTIVDWPQTEADLTRLSNNSECNNYSKACIADEEGCNWYSPKAGGDRIPGRFIPAEIVNNVVNWNDQCDEKCDGYNAYREMPSNYSMGQDIAYIIPKSGRQCAAQDEGCSAFTNLSINTAGSEQVEYYSYLRPCITMEDAKTSNVKTFITYEGTKESGFQLRTYIMRYNTSNNPNGVSGSPIYTYKDTNELNYLNSECTEQRYKDGVASLDCRQFNDQNGNIYYRMLSHLAPAHEKCTGYRLNDPDFYNDTSLNQSSCLNDHGFWDSTSNVCKKCVQNGEYRNGGCVYTGIPAAVDSTAGNSRACNASASSCRAYKGNAGNNVQTVFSENFEGPTALSGWSGGNIASVSTHVGEHSFEYTNSGTFTKTLSLEPGSSYDLTFWATGAQQTNLTVSLNGANPVTFSAGGAWKPFHLGPIDYNGNTTTAQLTFNNSANASVFIDNIKLVKVASYLYLVKDSLSVDPICDSNPNDNLPGEALGCTAYTDPQNRTFYLWNFSYLCREDAIGCTALYDTYNTDDKGPQAYKVWMFGNPGTNIEVSIGAAPNTSTAKCTVQSGQIGCYSDPIIGRTYAEILAAIPNGFVTSTQYIPGDSTSTPIYLVANKDASCTEPDLGCTLAGKQIYKDGTLQYVSTTIKNDPNDYKNTICESQAVGCNAFSTDEKTYYFKDPQSVGQNACVYRENVPYKATVTSTITRINGWFRKDNVGSCSNNPAIQCNKDVENVCGTGNYCQDVPCYPNYNTGSWQGYGLYSFGQTGYTNFIGECPQDQNTCTEFKDHADIVDGVAKSYFLKKDDKFTSGDCNGQISQKNGCVLLDQVNDPIKLYHTTSTYEASNLLNGVFVIPSSSVSATIPNDANLIVKVIQDRECGEWLKCTFEFSSYEPETNSYVPRCRGNLQRLQADPTNPLKDLPVVGTTTILSVDGYRYRSTGWYDLDYDGFTIFGMYPLELLDQFNFAATSTDPTDMRLVRRIDCNPATDYNCAAIGTGIGPSCGGQDVTQGAPCGPQTAPGVYSGFCWNKTCFQNMNGNSDSRSPIRQSCRAYPETDSPFPNTDDLLKSSFFKGANICNSNLDGLNGMSCECDYNKVQYGDGITKYFNTTDIGPYKDRRGFTSGVFIPMTYPAGWSNNGNQPPFGVCLGGFSTGTPSQDMSGKPCTTDSDCGDNGSCQRVKQMNKFVGWRGFCLEYDETRKLNGVDSQNMCTTWFPVETLDGAPDVNNQQIEAATDPLGNGVTSGGYYCTSGRGSTSTVSFDIQFSPEGINNSPTDPIYTMENPVFKLVARRCKNRLCWSTVRTDAYQYSRNHVNIANPAGRITVAAGNPVALQNIRTEDIESITMTAIAGTANRNKNIREGSSATFYNYPVSDNLQPYYNVDFATPIGGSYMPMGVLIGGFYPNYNGNFVAWYGSNGSDSAIVDRFLNFNTTQNTLREETGSYGFGGARTGLLGNLTYNSSLPLYFSNGTTNIDIWNSSISSNFYTGTQPISQVVTDPITDSVYQRRDFYLLGSTNTSYVLWTNPDPTTICDPADPATFTSDTCVGQGGCDPSTNFSCQPYYYYYDVSVANLQPDSNGDLVPTGPVRILSPTNTPLLSPNPTTTSRLSKVVINPSNGQPLNWNDTDHLSDPNLTTIPVGSGTANVGACPAYDQAPLGRSYLGRGNYDPNYDLWHAMRFTFDPTTRLFTGIDTAFCGARAAPPLTTLQWDTWRYQDSVTYRITIKLRRWCSSFANDVYDPLNNSAARVVAWTDRLFNVPNSAYSVVPGANPAINYDSSNSPYGRMSGQVAPSLNSPVVIDTPGTLPCGNGFYQYFSGTTYQCTASNGKYDFANVRGGQIYSDTTAPLGADRLATLFATVRDPFIWRNTGAAYGYASEPILARNVTESGDVLASFNPNGAGAGPRNPSAPQIHPIDFNQQYLDPQSQTVGYVERPEQGFSIDGGYSDVSYQEASKTVNLEFYMYADPNQMPVRQIYIDWDDGRTPVPATGFFRNRRGYADTTWTKRCQPRETAADFGSILDRTCDNGFFHAENLYSCIGNVSDRVWERNPANCGSNPALYPTGCCVFVPRVQVKDSWGWCNGACGTATSPGGTGCYDQTWTGSGGTNECSLDTNIWNPLGAGSWGVPPTYGGWALQGPWTRFGGKIIMRHQ